MRGHVLAISWRAIVLAILVITLNDAAGLLVLGDAGYRSPAYTMLRQVAPFGTMRTYGVVLVLLIVGALIAFGQYVATGRAWLLVNALAAIAGWQSVWLGTIIGSWWLAGQVTGWSAIGKGAFFAAACFVCARKGPPRTVAKPGKGV